MDVVFVVNGEEVSVSVASFSSLDFALREALDASDNLGRPPEDFELRYQTGNRVPDGIRAAELTSQPVYATLVLGYGGS